MKLKNLFKSASVALLLLLLIAVLALPAAAQGPEDEDGEVGAQAAAITGFVVWNPPFMNVPIGGATSAINRVYIDGAEQIWAITLFIGYDANVLTPDLAGIQPGNLVPGTRGVDYFMDIRALATPPACAGGVVPAGFRVSIAFTSNVGPIEGSGNLIEIPWQSLVGGPATPVCIDPTSQIVDQSGSGLPLPAVPPALLIPVAPADQFRIGLQGGVPFGKPANLNAGFFPAVPVANVIDVTVNGIPCVLPLFPAEADCAFGGVFPANVEVQRPGYLDVEVTFDTAADVRSVYMLAGDVNDDNHINILDLQQLASLLGTAVTYLPGVDSPVVERADFNFNGVVDIGDLVLAAWNFGQNGPTDGAVPPGVDF
jgi:hypothetical protein